MDQSIQEILQSMNSEQRKVLFALLQTAVGHDDSDGGDAPGKAPISHSDDINIQEVIDSMTEPQKEVMYILMDQALGGDKIKHSAEDDEDELIHYGIKGMKWGRRKSKQTTGSKGKKTSKKSSKKNPRRMSNKELMARIKRLELEKRYADAVSKSQKNQLMSDIFNVPTKAALFTGAVVTTMANIDRIAKLGSEAVKAYKKRNNM